MCRFLFYIGPPIILSDLITEPSNSLIHQSFESHEREEPLNGDGFGVAWYVPDIRAEPGLFRSISPAWSNRNLLQLAHVTRSHCVMAHVRAASEGLSVSESNCHPFSFGPFTFMHNGSLARFRQLKRDLLGKLSDTSFAMLNGTTDSEYLFAYYLDRWRETTHVVQSAERMAVALERTIVELVTFVQAHKTDDEESYLNMAVSDGEHAVVSRFTTDAPKFAESLHMHTGKLYHYENGVQRMIQPTEGHGAVLVSSEKLSEDFGWETIPANHIVVVQNDHTVSIRRTGS
jgi:glutamine amidotransferase